MFPNSVEIAVSIALILLIAWVAQLVKQRVIRLFKTFALRRSGGDPEDERRVETLARVFRYLLSIVIYVVAGMLILSELGISIAPILGAAGVVGIAVGFGAQSLVKDFFTGFVILFENQIRTGDVVSVAGTSGVVENVTLRTVRLRGYDGNVHFIPNGMIDTVTNMTMEFSYALIDVGIAYRENVDEVFSVMRETLLGMRADPELGEQIVEDLDLAGVNEWADSAVMIRARIKVKPLQQWRIRREYLRRLKAEFDARGIEIPFPHMTVYAGQAKDGTAPAFQVAGSR
ncbi:MAG: mechanosensitive ion channel family protein [Burkholderiales bacterium]|nr:MAG: mechanosensitive ion channel family protein [Burkholderiales bacterium]